MDKERQYSFIMTEENKSKVEQFLKLLNIDTEIIEAENVKEQKEWPQPGDVYYYFAPSGVINGEYFHTGSVSEHRLAIGNCFRTKEEADFEVKRLKVLAEMKKFAEPEDREWSNGIGHWSLYYDFSYNSIRYFQTSLCKSNNIYFESKEKAEECVETVGEDRIKKYYLKVEV